MAEQVCQCGKPTEAYVCPDCVDRLAKTLGNVPALTEELNLTLSRQRRFSADSGGSRNSERPMPFHVEASRAASGIQQALVAWVRFCVANDIKSADEANRPRDERPETLARWLVWRSDGLALHPEGTLAFDQITTAVETAQRIIDRPAERVYAGPCDQCGRDLYATLGKPAVTCADCNKTYDLAERRTWLLEQAEDRLATATEVARALTTLDLPVNADRIRQWKSRGQIVVKGHTTNSKPMYRVGDVIDLVLSDQPKERRK